VLVVKYYGSIKKVKLEIEVRIDMPVVDIIDDKHRLKAIEEDLVRSISKGLYEQREYPLKQLRSISNLF
jgi:hypothetical protein